MQPLKGLTVVTLEHAIAARFTVSVASRMISVNLGFGLSAFRIAPDVFATRRIELMLARLELLQFYLQGECAKAAQAPAPATGVTALRPHRS